MKRKVRAAMAALWIPWMLVAGTVHAGEVSSSLQTILEGVIPHARVDVIIKLMDRVDTRRFTSSDLRLRRSRIIKALKSKASETQGPIDSFLRGCGAERIKSLWLINGIAARVPAALVPRLAARPMVEAVSLDEVLEAPEVTPMYAGTAEWNLSGVSAPLLWDMGFRGQGTVVAAMDTGVDPFHQDFSSRWRGGSNSWFDPNGEHPDAPYDVNGHGTAVMGILVGGSEGGSAIGMAPEAEWIAVKIFNDSGLASVSAIHEGFQWLLDPDGDPETDDAPDVVNNSWGFDENPDQCIEGSGDISFRLDVQTLEAAEIGVVFAAGNTGPLNYTSVSPANYPESFAVGAVDEQNEIASFSGRGPSACSEEVGYPHVVAPGDKTVGGIRTTDLTGGGVFPDAYTYVVGTSVSSPHVTGAMALLRSALPDLTVPQMKEALVQSAKDLGDAGYDDAYGHGLIDVAAAHAALVDSVTITKASYVPDTEKLKIQAYSDATDHGVVLTAEALYGTSAFFLGEVPSDSTQEVFRIAPMPTAVKVKSSGGGEATADLGGMDSVTITKAAYVPDLQKLKVQAYTDFPFESVVLSAEALYVEYPVPLGTVPSNSDQEVFRIAPMPTAVKVKSSGGGAAVADLGGTDSVTITKATYVPERKKLKIQAYTDFPYEAVTLNAEALYGGVPTILGTVPSNSDQAVFRLESKPDHVRVTSTGGGQAVEPVP